jgi:hypothetical protein
MPQPKVLISILILLVIGLHAVPVLLYQGKNQTRWPFLTWAMYAKSRPPGPVVATRSRIMGLTLKGEAERVTGTLLGLPTATLGRRYLQPMKEGDSSTARQLFSRLNRNREDPFVELRIEGETYTATDTGVVKQDNPVITYRLDRSAK